MRRGWPPAALPLLAIVAGCGDRSPAPPTAPYAPPAGAIVTRLPARTSPSRTMTVEAATDVTFMRPFLRGFQLRHPDVAIDYVDTLSNSLLARALTACGRRRDLPDLYITVATDHLVRLANDGCASRTDVADAPPAWREWRHEVFAFALEPAVFVYNRRLLPPAAVPRSHLALVEALRDDPRRWHRRIGTYDIRQSGLAFNYAEFDAREAATFGRLIESLGRSEARLYCCSNRMVAAVRRGEVLLAYNVQLSYAYAAQRAAPEVGVVLPEDYQAVQTRSAMVPAGAPHRELGVLLLRYLLSPEARTIERRLLEPPSAGGRRYDPDAPQLNDADVSSSLLRLQDAARRRALTQEWLSAVSPPR